MSVVASLQSYRQHMLAGTLYKKWARDSPRMATAIEIYWEGGARPTNITSETGLALLAAADAYREAAAPPLPVDEPMPYPLAPITL